MAQYKATIFFQSINGLSGWSEIYYPASPSAGAAGAAVLAMIALRKGFLHPDCSIVNATLSDVTISGDSIILLGAPVVGTATDAAGYLSLDQAMLVRWTVDVFTRNKTYCRGLPVSATKDGKYLYPVGVNDEVDDWITNVLANFVFHGLNQPNPTPPPARILGYKIASNGVAAAKLVRRKVGRPFGLSHGRRLAG